VYSFRFGGLKFRAPQEHSGWLLHYIKQDEMISPLSTRKRDVNLEGQPKPKPSAAEFFFCLLMNILL
jgi:hypothetical protein